MPIYIKKTDFDIEISGDTYPMRHILKNHDAQWDAKAKAWSLPLTAEDWVRRELGAVERGSHTVVTKYKERDKEAATLSDADLQRLRQYVDKAVDNKAEALKPDMAEANAADIQALAKSVNTSIIEEVGRQNEALVQRLNEIEKEAQANRVLEVRTSEGAHVVKGLAHPLLDDLITGLAAGLHVWVAGPSGSGKTHGAMQAAEALGLKFEAQGAMTMAHELTGFVDAGGKYHETPFVRAFRSGGLILLDEIDAGSNEALLCLNAALANGFMSLPSGEVLQAHKDFKCVGAANTFGNGATAEYVGRVRIDQAFLQRFGMRLDWGYNEDLERQMTCNDEWVTRVQRARKSASVHGVKVMITPRQSQAGAKLIAMGMDADKAAKLTYLSGLSAEQAAMIESGAKNA
ncbi:MAG: AAA family ATPase [Epibacterium sp.]|nr:AAA family ATPase [Epibacterium sp.]NQX74088.1 AAA family ATPase [Epibacterium sp.]